MTTTALGFLPFGFGKLGLFGRMFAEWVRVMPATARRLQQQEAALERFAQWQKQTGITIPKDRAGLDLRGAFARHNRAMNAYRTIMAAITEAYADATRTGKIKPSDVQFRKVFRDGSMEGLGTIPWLIVIVATLGVVTTLWQMIEETSEVVIAIGVNRRNMLLLDNWLAWGDRYVKQNPNAPPPTLPFSDPSSGSTGTVSILGNIGPMISVGVGLWVLSMLPKRGAQ